MSPFGKVNKQHTIKSIPQSIKKIKASIWRQFRAFCKVRNYEMPEITPLQQVAYILKNWD